VDAEQDAAVERRAIGAFLGLATADALGTTLEFAPRDSRPLHTEIVGGGPFRLAPGVWTDDTQMALALVESLLSWWRSRRARLDAAVCALVARGGLLADR
jgi:ADP-ribosylglycohydrolase